VFLDDASGVVIDVLNGQKASTELDSFAPPLAIQDV